MSASSLRHYARAARAHHPSAPRLSHVGRTASHHLRGTSARTMDRLLGAARRATGQLPPVGRAAGRGAGRPPAQPADESGTTMTAAAGPANAVVTTSPQLTPIPASPAQSGGLQATTLTAPNPATPAASSEAAQRRTLASIAPAVASGPQAPVAAATAAADQTPSRRTTAAPPPAAVTVPMLLAIATQNQTPSGGAAPTGQAASPSLPTHAPGDQPGASGPWAKPGSSVAAIPGPAMTAPAVPAGRGAPPPPPAAAPASPLLARAMAPLANSAAGLPAAGNRPSPTPGATTPTASPTAQDGGSSGGPTQGDVYLDGARVGRWMATYLARSAARPPGGTTGFDPRQTIAWPGAAVGS